MADKAILFGINDYENISDLKGCHNDVENVHKLLVNQFGFKKKNIHIWKDRDVVLSRIRSEFEWLFEDLEPGDRAVFHFAGHGSYVDSEDDDEPVDEILCLWDMDWNDRGSYLVDDDFGKLTKGLPDGVHLTIGLDACHSADGTRAVNGARKLRAVESADCHSKLIIESDTIEMAGAEVREKTRSLFQESSRDFQISSSDNPVLARFVLPPESVQKKRSQFREVRSLGAKIQREELNHTLLAACREDQTAADAYIGGKYQGAFSHYLCKNSRLLGEEASVTQLMNEVRSQVAEAGHSQVPQLQGIGQNQRLYGGEAASWDVSGMSDQVDQWGGGDLGLAGGQSGAAVYSPEEERSLSGQRLEVLSRLLDMQEKFLELGSAVLGKERGSLAQVNAMTGNSERSAAGEQIVYVHGISRHVPGYSDDWYRALSRHLSRPIPKGEVLWSDLVNPRSAQAQKSRSVPKEEREFLNALRKELEERQSVVESTVRAQSAGDVSRYIKARGDGFALDDFARYMTSQATRNSILKRFYDVVVPQLEAGKTLHLISHSWGTVVAYEGLRNLDSRQFPGKVENLICLGSALAIKTVRWNLFQRLTDGRLPVHVRRMFNLDAGGDVVGGKIGGPFPVTEEKVGLPPVGCMTVPFTGLALNPVCAHSSYFNPKNLLVNRDYVARWINGS